jgi:hypothetical protein
LGELPEDVVRRGEQMLIVAGPRRVVVRALAGTADAGRLTASIGAIEAAIEAEDSARSASASSPGPLTDAERKALEAGGLDLRPARAGEPDPALEGAARFARLVNESLSAAEAAERLGVNESRIRQRLLAKPPTLYAIKAGREWRLPRFQFGRKGAIPGLPALIEALPDDIDVVSLESWLMTPNPDLALGEDERPLSPLDWLNRGGAPARIAELAREL